MQTTTRLHLNWSYYFKLRRENACEILSGIKKLCSCFSRLPWTGDNCFPLSDAGTSPPDPRPWVPPYRIEMHSPNPWRAHWLSSGSVLMHTLQICTFMSTRKTLLTLRRVLSIRSRKIQTANGRITQTLCHPPFEQHLNLWGKNIGGSDELFFFFVNHGFLILREAGGPQRKGSTGFLDIK